MGGRGSMVTVKYPEKVNTKKLVFFIINQKNSLLEYTIASKWFIVNNTLGLSRVRDIAIGYSNSFLLVN